MSFRRLDEQEQCTQTMYFIVVCVLSYKQFSIIIEVLRIVRFSFVYLTPNNKVSIIVNAFLMHIVTEQ